MKNFRKIRIPLGKVTMSKYSDGGFNLLTKSLSEEYVFIVCSTFPNSDNLMELLLMIDAAKRASARHIYCCNTILVGQDKIEKTSQEFR
jgi:ribose-phosphate pyrophosphokinase